MPTNKVNNNIKLESGGGLVNSAVDGLSVGGTLPSSDGSNLTGVPTSVASTASESLSATNSSGSISSISDTATMPADANFAIITVHLTTVDNGGNVTDSDATIFCGRTGTFKTTSAAKPSGGLTQTYQMTTTVSISGSTLTVQCEGLTVSTNSHSYTLSGTAYFFK